MNFLPGKRSRGWIWICVLHWVILYAAILASRAVLRLPLLAAATASLALLALLPAVIAGAGGWLGGRLFFLCTAAGSLIGVGYMLILSVSDAAPGWGDLVSLIGFAFLSLIGLGAGLIAELIRSLLLRNKSNNRNP